MDSPESIGELTINPIETFSAPVKFPLATHENYNFSMQKAVEKNTSHLTNNNSKSGSLEEKWNKDVSIAAWERDRQSVEFTDAD